MSFPLPTTALSTLPAAVSRRSVVARSLKWAVTAGTFLIAAVVVGEEPPSATSPGKPCPAYRAGDEVWLASTREIGCVTQATLGPMWRLDADKNAWQNSTADEFHAGTKPEMLTLFYVHGNRKDAAGAQVDGLATYREIVAKHETAAKVRFVIWSWPSDQIRGPVRDIRSKAARSDEEAILLARFLHPYSKEQRVGLIGFSFGGRIVGGAMHLLGGGRLNGAELSTVERPEMRVVFWAAAEHNHWLLPGDVHGNALPQGKQWLNIYSGCDSVLWRYDRLDKCDPAHALGFTGLMGRDQLRNDLKSRYEDWEASQLVGSEHDSEPYLYAPDVARRTSQILLWQDN